MDLREPKEIALHAREQLLPIKSISLYENVQRFPYVVCTEDTVLAYFNSELSSYRTSLWSKYSMLRSTINLNEGVDISKFPSLIPNLKTKGDGHEAKKSLTLSKENVYSFLMNANHAEHLLKVILIFGVAGVCRRHELVSLETTNVEDHNTHFLVKFVETKTKSDRSFIIVPGNFENLNLVDDIRKYRAIRSPNIPHNRFFINYTKEKMHCATCWSA